jgi:Uma2 family endonuclease
MTAAATVRLTASDLDRLPNGERTELIDGVPLPLVPPSLDHGDTAGLFVQRLRNFRDDRDLGGMIGPEIAFGFGPGDDPATVLLPDAAYVREEVLPPKGQRCSMSLAPPDLAIEILSPTNSAIEIERKVAIYLDGGTRMVWVVNPFRRAVTVHLPDRTARTLVEGDVLDGGDVLPGFTLPVRDIFR